MEPQYAKERIGNREEGGKKKEKKKEEGI